jgi:hypothetical protein
MMELVYMGSKCPCGLAAGIVEELTEPPRGKSGFNAHFLPNRFDTDQRQQ